MSHGLPSASNLLGRKTWEQGAGSRHPVKTLHFLFQSSLARTPGSCVRCVARTPRGSDSAGWHLLVPPGRGGGSTPPTGRGSCWEATDGETQSQRSVCALNSGSSTVNGSFNSSLLRSGLQGVRCGLQTALPW